MIILFHVHIYGKVNNFILKILNTVKEIISPVFIFIEAPSQTNGCKIIKMIHITLEILPFYLKITHNSTLPPQKSENRKTL